MRCVHVLSAASNYATICEKQGLSVEVAQAITMGIMSAGSLLSRFASSSLKAMR